MRPDPPAGPPDATLAHRPVPLPIDDGDPDAHGRATLTLAGSAGNGHGPAGPIAPGLLEEAALGPPAIGEGPPPPPPAGPPGGALFSLEGRPAPGLYFAAWALSLVGIVALFVALQTGSSIARGVLFVVGLVVLTGGMSLGAGYQVLARGMRPADVYRGPAPLLLFLIATAASTAVGAVLFGLGALDTEAPLGFLLAIGVVQAAYLGVIVLFVRRTGVLTWSDMGWRDARSLLTRILSDAGLAFAVMLPSTLAVAVFAGLVASALDVTAPSVLPSARSSADALAVVLSAAFIAPIGEELFFRGFALTAWHRDLGPRRALIRSSLFFALVHVANVDATDLSHGLRQALLVFIVILPLGFVLGWLFQRRGIVAAIAGHCTYNGFLLVVLFTAQRVAAPG